VRSFGAGRGLDCHQTVPPNGRSGSFGPAGSSVQGLEDEQCKRKGGRTAVRT
jgi:hypothetical protein